MAWRAAGDLLKAQLPLLDAHAGMVKLWRADFPF